MSVSIHNKKYRFFSELVPSVLQKTVNVKGLHIFYFRVEWLDGFLLRREAQHKRVYVLICLSLSICQRTWNSFLLFTKFAFAPIATQIPKMNKYQRSISPKNIPRTFFWIFTTGLLDPHKGTFFFHIRSKMGMKARGAVAKFRNSAVAVDTR